MLIYFVERIRLRPTDASWANRPAVPRFRLAHSRTSRVPSQPQLQATEEDAAPVVPETAATGQYSSMDMSDVELAEQSAKLEALAAMWKKREDMGEYEEGLRSGWGPSPERINGRAAMVEERSSWSSGS